MSLYGDLTEVLTPYANQIKSVKADLDDLNDIKSAVTVTPTYVGALLTEFSIQNGDTVRATNATNGNMTVRLRASAESIIDLQTVVVPVNTTIYFTAIADATYISTYYQAVGGTATYEVGRLSTLEKQVAFNSENIAPLTQPMAITAASIGSVEQQHSVQSGETLKIINNSIGGVELRLREVSGGTNIQTIYVNAGQTSYLVATNNTEYVSVYFNQPGTVVLDIGRLSVLEKQVASNLESIAALTQPMAITATSIGGVERHHSVQSGETLKIINNSIGGVELRLREVSGGTNIQTIYVNAGQTSYLVATNNTEYVSVYFNQPGTVVLDKGRIPADEQKINNLASDYQNNTGNIFDFLVLENGGIKTNGDYQNVDTRLRTINRLQNEFKCHCPNGFVIYYAFFFNENDTVDSFELINAQTATITVPSGKYCKLTFAKSNLQSTISVEEIKSSYVFEEIYNTFNEMEYPPMVVFDLNNFSLDSNVTEIVEEKNYTRNSNSIFQIYSYFDELVDNDYVTKVDLATEMSISYPSYANGIAAGDTTYLETPAYKTYMYKFICANENVNTALFPKRKVIILGGVHGDEQAAPFNLYIFAKRLCNDFLTDDNFFKLRSAFDFYIVPCVNGYGMIHSTRVNANGVNINRNFPIAKWVSSGAGTGNYTGETAGSEFETQLVMALVNSVKPNMFIDHHNYSYNLDTQFYSDVFDVKQNRLIYQSLADISYVLKHNYPTYFGTGFDFVKHTAGNPGIVTQIYVDGTTVRWAYEKKVPLAVTIEISDCINYLNGIHVTSRQEFYSTKTFTIAEYTLRQQLLRYGQWVLEN